MWRDPYSPCAEQNRSDGSECSGPVSRLTVEHLALVSASVDKELNSIGFELKLALEL